MKKLFFSLTILIVVILGGIYALLFTSSGNSYLASIIEDKVNEGQQDVNLKVNDFKLTMSDILFKATIDDNSVINIEGELALLAKSVDLKYDINIKDLSKLQNITKQKLNGSFSTQGIIKGNQEKAVVKGDSKVASSNTKYDITLVDFKPSNILFNMKNAKIEELLYLVNQPIYANGKYTIDANIKNANIGSLDGLINTKITNGVLNAKVINKELKQNPKTPILFVGDTSTKLSGNQADIVVDFSSSLANLDIKKANINLETSEINSDYTLFVKNLSKLETLINQKFNGSFTTKGNVNIKDGVIQVNGGTDIFSSDTNYDIKVANSKPQNINLKVNTAKIESILSLINQPIYAKGKMNIDAKIKSADIANLDGKIVTTILESTVNNPIVNKNFNQKLKSPLVFKGDVITNLSGTKAISKVDLDTTVTNLDMAKAVYDISKAEFTSDYTINFTDLSKLYDLTQQKLRGSAKLNGNIKQGKDLLSVDGSSKLFGGDITFNLLNDDFKAKIDGVEVKDLTHMLYYPEVFTSKSNIDVNYNLATKNGKVDGNLIDGQFIKNEFSDIIATFAKFDLTKEIYEKVELKSEINDNIINSFVDMKSKYTIIKVPSSTIDTKKNTVNALVQAKITKYSFDTKIKGSLSNPKISVDTDAFLKEKIKKKTDKYKKKFEEKLQKKLGKQFKLDKLFNKAPSNDKGQTQKAASNEEIAKAFKAMFGN